MPEGKIKRMNLNVPADLHDAFKAATAAQGKNMTDVLVQNIKDYVSKHGLAPAPDHERCQPPWSRRVPARTVTNS